MVIKTSRILLLSVACLLMAFAQLAEGHSCGCGYWNGSSCVCSGSCPQCEYNCHSSGDSCECSDLCSSNQHCCTDAGDYCCPDGEECCDGDCCDTADCEDCNNGVCEYQCCSCEVCNNGICEFPDGHDCCDGSDCADVQICSGCKCTCDDSGNSWHDISYSYDASGLLNGIENAIDNIPRLSARNFTLNFEVGAQEKEVCCDPEDTSYTSRKKLYGKGEVGGGVDITLVGLPEFEFNHEWEGVGGIDCNVVAGITGGAEVTANATISGFVEDCPDEEICLTAGGGADIDIDLTAEGGVSIRLYTCDNWLWDEHELPLTATISGSIGCGAGASGSYYVGKGCLGSGFELDCAYIDSVDFTAELEFEVWIWGPYTPSKTVTLWDGYDNPDGCHS